MINNPMRRAGERRITIGSTRRWRHEAGHLLTYQGVRGSSRSGKTRLMHDNAPYFLSFVSSGKSSVRNGEAGRPAALKKLGSARPFQAKRTATGAATFSLSTTTVSPS